MKHLLRTTSENPDFRDLVVLLDADLKIRDGDDHAFYNQFNKIDALRNAVVCYLDGRAVGCGAFRPFDAETVEIKRMFVHPDFRGRGIAGEILAELERWAAASGYTACVLETGKNQPEAIRLYQKSGYAGMPNYGPYAGIDNSVCMRKPIRIQ